MAIDEETRHRMYQRLEEVLGMETATALMDHLPPVGWADVATKRDLDVLRRELALKFEAFDYKFEAMDHKFEAAIHREARTTIVTMMAGNTALAGLILAAVRLI